MATVGTDIDATAPLVPHLSVDQGADGLSDTFRERKAPRDLLDILLFVPMTAAVGPAFFGVPAAAIYGGLRLSGWRDDTAVPAAVLAGLAALIDLALLVSLPAYKAVTLDREGLLFRRYVGPAKRVPWESLRGVRAASRGEVFRRIWLWPGFPPRGSLWCGSTKGQFLVEWAGGRYYFAPKDVAGFLDSVRLRRPDLVAGVRHGDEPGSRPLLDREDATPSS